MDRSRKGPYLRAHNKLSLGLDRLLPAIAAVESSTLELMGPGQASASSVGFKESETKQLQARSTGGLRRVTKYAHSQPLWLDAPPSMKAPKRVPYTPAGSEEAEEDGDRTHDSSSRLLKDFNVLAAASQRANNTEKEGDAYFCLSVLHSNQGKFGKAGRYLDSFLRASQAVSNANSQLLAVNALGVNCHLLAQPAEASHYHMQHLDAAHDHTGQFIAYTNLGVVLGEAGDLAAAKTYHEGALRAAVQAADVNAEACATANLGRTAMEMGSFEDAQSLLERFLRMAELGKDQKGISDAFMFLGKLASEQHDLNAASEYYGQAMNLSTTDNREASANTAKCSFGVVSGAMSLNTHMDALKLQLAGGAPALTDA